MGQPAQGVPLPAGGEYIAVGSEPGELKHLSTQRKRKQSSDPPSSGERTGASLNRCSASVLALLHRGRGILQKDQYSFSELPSVHLTERYGMAGHRG